MSRPRSFKISKIDYCQYLFSTQINYTLTNYAEMESANGKLGTDCFTTLKTD